MELTVTTDVKRKTISDANKELSHNLHDPEHQAENQGIIYSDSYLNKHIKLLSRYDVLQNQYGDMISKRVLNNQKRFLDGRIGLEEYKKNNITINDYLNGGKSPKQCITDVIWTLGNVDSEFKLLDKLGFDYEQVYVKDKDGKHKHAKPRIKDPKQRQEFVDILTETYVNLAKQINNSDCGFKVTEVTVHADEGGMIHAHAEMVNCGHTPSGRPSYNLNAAFGEFCETFGKDVKIAHSKSKSGKVYKRVNGSIALKTFRSIIDKQMVQNFNDALERHHLLNNESKVNMVRLGKTGGKTMEEYQAEKAMEKTLQTTYKALTGDKPLRKDGKPLAPLTMARTIHTMTKNVKKEHDELTDNVDKLKKEVKQQGQHADEAQRRLVNLQQRERQLIRQRNKEQQELDKQKNKLVDALTAYQPEHLVPKNKLAKGEIPCPVSTPEGREQHKEQGIVYLVSVVLTAAKKVARALATINRFVDTLTAGNNVSVNSELGRTQINIGSIGRSRRHVNVEEEQQGISDPLAKVEQAINHATAEKMIKAREKALYNGKDNETTR